MMDRSGDDSRKVNRIAFYFIYEDPISVVLKLFLYQNKFFFFFFFKIKILIIIFK